MKTIQFSLLTLVASFLLVSCVNNNTLTQKETEEGWELLFNGTDLSQWKAYNSDDPNLNGWYVKDGCMVSSGKGSDMTGYVVTNKEYDNFILEWDWMVDKGGNSGMLYHVIEAEKYATPYLTGPEYQMLDDKGFPEEVQNWQRTGSDYAMHSPDYTQIELKKSNQWNTSRIVFDNGHVEHWLNGVKLFEFQAWTDEWFDLKNSGKWENMPEYGLAKLGKISLQDHGSVTWVRNIKIKSLPRKEKTSDLFNGTDLNNWINYGTEKWYVEDSMLVCENGPDMGYGYLGTREYYQDFDLTVDFKQVVGGNSGVFIRSTCEGTTINGWQVEVAPKNNDTGGIYESYGRGWLVQIPDEKETILKENDWNTLRILVQGDRVQTFLNGESMVDLTDAKIGAGKGRICLQIHDKIANKVYWKNLKITEL